MTTLEDSLNEADETFTVSLTAVTGPAGVSLGTSSVTGTIEDDDPIGAELGTHTANVAEGDDATYEVDLSGGTSTAPVVVNYAVDTSSTAASGTDYTAPSGKLTITAGESSGTITIATLDTDGVLDPGETLVVKLMSASTATRTVTVDDTATATTTILEEDKVTVSVAAVMVADDDKSDVEESETASFVVTLSGTVSGVVQVPYTTANVTAESGSDKDYTAASGTLEFQAGDTSKTIEVTTLEDGLNEADETYTLTLTAVTGPDGVSLGTSSATGTIEDDDPVSAALGTYTEEVAEGDDATYEVNLTGGTSTAEVVVNYAVDTSSTATSGTDYTAPSGKLTIAAEGTSGTITIVTLDNDGVLDPGETLVVKLTSASTATRTVTVDDTAQVTTTILEEDMVTVSVADDDKSKVEEGETASFVVSLTGAVSGVVQVPYETANGTAESGTNKDYTAASGTLEFSAGDTSKTIEVTTLEDSLNEADETFTVSLTAVTGPAGVSLGTSSVTGTIEDDDPIGAELGTHTANVAEGDDATYEVDLSGGTSTASVVVNYAVDTSSTAASGTDYTAPSGKLTITAGESSGTITIATLDTDGALDPGETLVVKLTSASTATRPVTVDDTEKLTTTILEEDMVTVSVAAVMVEDDALTQDVNEADDKSKVEEGETASFVVALTGAVSGVVQVPYTTANGTAESGANKDYTAASGTLEFQAGDTSKTIDVTTLEDSYNEADETFTLTLTSVTGPDGVSLGTSSATGTIEDDDPVSAALGTHTANVAEGDDATYEVDLSGGTSTASVVVNYELDSTSTATAVSDYTVPSGKLTITAGESSGTITIATLDTDGVLDPGETLVVKLTSASTDTRTVTVDDAAQVTTTILEQDMVTVSVAAVMVADDPLTQDVNEADDKSKVEEGETASFVVALTGAVSGVVQVPYTTANGTAESGTNKDYTAASGTLEFSAGDTSKTIEVTTLEDSYNEADETFTLTLTSVTGPDGVSLGTSSATGTIEDDDPVSAALGTHTANVAEGDDATYEVTLSGGTSTAAVVVNYAVDTSSTATSGTDYTAPSGKLTITAGESSGTITIATLDNDGVLDPGETLVVKLTSASTATRTVTVVDTDTKTTTIADTGTVKVSLKAGTTEVKESKGTSDLQDRQSVKSEEDDQAATSVEEGETAMFIVELSGLVASQVTVPYTTANVTAESGSDKDYTATSGTLEFQAGDTSKTIEVTTLEDSLNEADETFTVSLTAVTGPAGVSLGTSSVTGTIEDDDPIGAELGTHTANVAEGDDATYEVDLSGGTSTAPVVVNYAVDTSSAAASGTDYTAPSGKLTITAGESSGTITIATLDTDGVLDPGETLVVKLMSASTATRTVTVDDTATATTTILEEDMVTVSVAAVMVANDDKSDVEEGETASFVVTLSGTVSGVVQVPYTTANGTAESGSDKDYTAASGTLEFSAGDISKTIEVATLEDSLNEADETFTVTLTGVTGPAGVSLGTSSATGTIEDDDPVSAALGTHTENVAEGDDATYEVNLTGGTSTAEVVVNYAVDTSSTATSGTDYTAPSGKLTIAAEGTSGTITIATLDNDGVLDPGETLVVKLTSATTDARTVTVDDTATKTTTIDDTGSVKVSLKAHTTGVEDSETKSNVQEGQSVKSEDSVEEDQVASSVEEGDTAEFIVELSGLVASTVTVTYGTADGTAESGSDKDYTAASGTLEFQAGDTSKTIEVTTLEDSLNESDETFTLTLTAVTGPNGVSLGTSSAAGTIEDDDPISAQLGTYTSTVKEGDDATYEVNLSGGKSTAPVVVNYAVDTSSTATSGTDYTAPSGKLTIAAEGTSGTITIATLNNDGVLDPGETLVVKLTSARTDARTVTVDDTATATTTILEEDKVTVSVAAVMVADDDKSDVEEGETASFVVALTGAVSGVVQVPYTTANGTAESGANKDYTAASGTLEFQAGDTSKTIEVTTLEDSLNEADETFTLTLTSVTGPAGVSLGTSSATGTIKDDDPISAALETHTANVAEGDDATYEVNLSGGTSTAAVVVNYAVDTSSTATSGTDYTAPSGKLTITAGEISGTITIATLDTDGVLDPGETLVVKLTSASTDTRPVTVDDTEKLTTTIADSGMVKVSVQDATASEGDTASFAVELTGAVASVVQVTYATADDTAASGTGKDYTAANGTLEFSAGDISKTIEVTMLQDALDEENETFTLTLTASNLPSGVSLDDAEATGTITDDDTVPGVPTGVSPEGANRQVTLQWSAPSSPGTSPITGYEYRYKSGTNDYPATWESAGGPTATSTTVSSLTNDIEYTFALRAVSDAGDGEAVEITATPFWANVVPTFTSTATPSVAENVKLAVTLQATDDDGDAVVGFAITGGADSDMFAIDDSGGLLFETAPNFEDPKDVASASPANDATNNQYVVVVTVTSGTGDRVLTAEQTITVTVTDAKEVPQAPGAPEVDTVSITSLRARWLAPTNTGPPITDYDYRYRIKTPQGEWNTLQDTTSTVLEQIIGDLQENTEYQVQVRANNEEGEGAWSESGEGETEANAAPHFTSSAAFEIAENSTAAVGGVTADDTDTEDDVEAYAIVGGEDKLLFSIDAAGALSFKNAPNHEAPQDKLSTTPPNDAGNNQYVMVVMAVSGENEREKSAKQTIVVTVTDEKEPPLAPDAPTVVPASPTSLTVTWSDKTDVNRPAATEYHYQHSVKGQDDWTEVTGHTSTSVTITGLTKETVYEVQVKAESDEGTSDWSDSGEGRTPEMPVVTLALDPDSIAEGGVSTVTATVAPAADAAFEIEVLAATDSGDDAEVFELSTNVTLRFEANETASSGTVTISAVDNAVDEDDKTVTVSGTASAGAEVLAPADQTLTITDDDVLATVTALESTQCDPDSDPSACVEEGNDALFPVTLTGGTTTAAVVIGYEVTSEDATEDVDYTAPSDGLLTIAQGESTGTITVETNGDDDILDPGETLKVTLTSGSTTAGGVQVSDEPATMTIADTGQVNVSVADAEAAEGDAVNFAVKLSRRVASGVTVSYQTANDTAESGIGKDYTAASGTLTFAADVKVMTVAVITLDDALDESDESFALTLTALDGPAGVTLSDGEAAGTIQDDDTRGVTVSTNALTAVKGGDSVSYTLRLRSQPTGDVTIGITGPGGGVLVSPAQMTFTPQTWSTTQGVQVSATADAAAGTTPSISHSVSGADYAGVTANSVTVTIDEQAGVGLGVRPKSGTGAGGTAGAAGSNLVYTEGETIEFYVERTTSSRKELTIGVTVTQNGDFISGSPPTMVKLGQHETEKDIVINTEDDAIVEPDGSVTVTISCDCAVREGTKKVEVLNNDAEFSVDNAEAVESEGQITFTVRKRSSLKVAMDLQYETMNGSATAGKDYEQPEDGAMVRILPEQDHATVTIPITDDTLVEGDESFRLRVFHTIDRDFDAPATGTIKDDDAAVAKAWLARFGRTVASHVVEAVDARLTGELGPTTQVTLGGTTLPSALAPIQPNAVAAMPHTSIEGGAFLAGSSFQVLASESGGESAGTGLTMWGHGAATGLQASDDVVSSLKGQVGTGTVGVDYDWGGILAGLAVAYSGGGADYKLAGDRARADEAASWLISAHPYARAQILGDRLTAWGLLGYGLGQMTLAKGSEDETGISMMMGALGLRGVLSPETNRFGLTVKSDAFLTHMTAGEGGLVTTGAHRARLLAEGTYRMDFGAGGVLIPRLVTGVRYDFGDAEEGFGAEMGGAVTYTYPAWGLTASGNLRVLLTHQDSGFEQWGGGGSLRVTPGAAGLGPSVAVNTSLGAPASGAQRLWTSGVAHGSAPAASAAPGAHIDAEMGYGLTVLGGGGMVTPYVGMAVAEKGARAFRLGGRLSVGPAFSLSVEGERREESAGAAAHAVSVNGALRW